MTPEQKQQAKQLIADWTNVSRTSTPAVWFLNGDCMAGFLQELVDAPEPEPVARVTGYYAGYLSIATVDGSVLPAGTALYAAPPHQSEHHLEMVNTPAPSVPDGWIRAIDEAMVVHHIGIADRADSYEVAKKKLNALLAINSDIARDCSEAPADLDAPEFSDGCEKEGFPGGCARMGCCKQLPATADLVRDSVASEPVGYLYTNVQSGEYHVSDYDDDYRGPERALWCIEPVYRRAKCQS